MRVLYIDVSNGMPDMSEFDTTLLKDISIFGFNDKVVQWPCTPNGATRIGPVFAHAVSHNYKNIYIITDGLFGFGPASSNKSNINVKFILCPAHGMYYRSHIELAGYPIMELEHPNSLDEFIK